MEVNPFQLEPYRLYKYSLAQNEGLNENLLIQMRDENDRHMRNSRGENDECLEEMKRGGEKPQ